MSYWWAKRAWNSQNTWQKSAMRSIAQWHGSMRMLGSRLCGRCEDLGWKVGSQKRHAATALCSDGFFVRAGATLSGSPLGSPMVDRWSE
jgi:hypothetical protein